MLKEAHRLYRLGFAIHWLKERSKVPLNGGWTTGPRTKWGALKAASRPGLNIGVRLGKASKLIDGGYLAVIDCDVKSTQEKHHTEMTAKLRELFGPSILEGPWVLTGRGNGSAHIYVMTEKPQESFRVAQSKFKVKVLMPSVDPTPKEHELLSAKELAQGMRLRAAWEIDVMGEGRQVVLPPSIHPDTGKRYAWTCSIDTWQDVPAIELGAKPVKKEFTAGPDTGAPFVAVEVDLIGSNLSSTIVDRILFGKGCNDRSASLFLCSMAMVKAGFNDNQILSVLTDKTNYLGATGYEHAKTSNRSRAAQWVRTYTLAKAKFETSAQAAFKGVPIESGETLSQSEVKRQEKKTLGNLTWRDKIDRTAPEQGAKPKPTLQNVCIILRGEASPDVFKYNEFSGMHVYSRETPWFGREGAELKDIDLVEIKHWLSENYAFEPHTSLILEAVQKIANENRFHPVREFLATLKWDGKSRLDTWLRVYLGAKGPDDYLSAVGRKTLVGMIKRVQEPGSKFDYVLILEGKQGCGKSTAVRWLADPWFSDGHINIADKDGVLSMRSVWVKELGELSGMRKADVDQLKEFVSRQADRIRAPYGRMSEDFPRQCIFIGTTNSSEYLKDPTGNRRFWPVAVTKLDRKAFSRDRDQLLAEAVVAYDLGEPTYLEHEGTEALATKEQWSRVWEDEWAAVIGAHLERDKRIKNFTTLYLFSDEGPLPQARGTVHDQMRAATSLKMLGYVQHRTRVNGVRGRYWKRVKKESS